MMNIRNYSAWGKNYVYKEAQSETKHLIKHQQRHKTTKMVLQVTTERFKKKRKSNVGHKMNHEDHEVMQNDQRERHKINDIRSKMTNGRQKTT